MLVSCELANYCTKPIVLFPLSSSGYLLSSIVLVSVKAQRSFTLTVDGFRRRCFGRGINGEPSLRFEEGGRATEVLEVG